MIYFDDKWCRNITIKERLLKAVKCRPFGMPREFNEIIHQVAMLLLHAIQTGENYYSESEYSC